MIGRQREKAELLKAYESSKAELVAIYGRYGVGKTTLVEETLKENITFHHIGLAYPQDKLKIQLSHFYSSLLIQGMEPCKKPESWLDAFLLLEMHLQKIGDGKRQLVFFDELHWMDTPRSGFLQAFEGFWNNWGCHRKNLMVIVCGSANSWILNKLINAHGGLYGRVTREIKLTPFTLHECEEYYKANNIKLSRYDIVQSYMILGGIPFYMRYIDGELSLAQNIDNLFFSKNAQLMIEYDRLFSSVFESPERIKTIVNLLGARNAGFTRKEIVEKLGITDGVTITSALNALITSDFIIKYVPFGFSKREAHYKLIDPFCLFYIHFMNEQKDAWQQNVSSQSLSTWRGYAFENVCFNHTEEIKRALGISGVITESSQWSKRGDDEKGAQIDLLIIRKDNVINMCELKFYSGDFEVTKDYYRTLLNRETMLQNEVSPKVAIRNTLITTFGLKKNEYSGIFTNVILLDDLF